ncbi:MAG: hypothetical protein HY553_14990 [Elusimicrobia bacterium]|nr:hypothetical protein [Elusimicrobiota bacterium]
MQAWLLAALLAAPVPVSAGEPSWKKALREQAALHSWDPLDGRFANETVAALQRLRSAAEHLRFVKARGIDLKVTEPNERLPATAIGSYIEEENAMYINQDELMKGAGELRRQGAPEEAIPEILAWKFLPTTIHEIRHAMTRDRIRRQLGIDLKLNPLEGEYISFLDEARVFREAVRVRPELWSDPSRILEVERTAGRILEELDRGVPALQAMVDAMYDGKPSLLREPRDKLIEEYERRRASLEKDADELLKTDLRTITDADTREDLAEVAYTVADGIVLYKQMLGILKSPARYEQLQGFYRREVESLGKAAAKTKR